MSIDSTTEHEQAYLRNDLHQLSQVVQVNNFNVKKYQQKNNVCRKSCLRTKYSDHTRKRVSTEPIEDRVRTIEGNFMSQTGAIERVMVKNEANMEKRMALTGSLKYRNLKSYSQSKSKMETETQEELQMKKCKEIQKKHHRGRLEKKVIEAWLNNILMESTQFEIIDESLTNAALKKFEIDENSLLSRGIKPENIERIYSSLFVHSIGFNNSLKQLVHSQNQPLKSIWKVYSILLEFCAEGKFETIVGSIERDKSLKIQQLRQQIMRRQEIIEKNDEINETKNIEIFKEIKHLKQQNINLSNQKDILYEDYQKTEQAFNQEVALRLKFQNKINELFGVHRQLGIKHKRLYDDYKKKILEWTMANEKNAQLHQINWDLKMQVNDLIALREKLEKNAKYNSEYISALKEDKIKLKDEANFYKHQYDEERRVNKELKRRVTQLEIEVKNMTEVIEIKHKSWKQTHSQYQISLEQNSRLYQIINDQRTQVESLLYDKKQFNNKILNLMADASFEKKRKQQYHDLYTKTEKELSKVSESVKKFELQIKVFSERCKSYQEDLHNNYENIRQMHKKNTELEEQLGFLTLFKENLQPIIEQKDRQIEKYKGISDQLSAKCENLKDSFNYLELKFKNLTAQYNSDTENFRLKIERMREQRDQFQSDDSAKSSILSRMQSQLEKYTKLFNSTLMDLKNEKFQRVNLKSNYDQSLMILDKKNKQERLMGIQISELKELINQITQERNKLLITLDQETQKKQKAISQRNESKLQYQKLMQKKSSYVHPSVYEDAAANYFNLRDKYEREVKVCSNLREQMKKLEEQNNREIAALTKSKNQSFNNLKREKQREIYQKETQLEYEKEKNLRMQSRLQKLESLAQTYTKKIEERTASEKEKIYAEIIEEKTKSINQLASKLLNESSEKEKIRQKLREKQEQHASEMSQAERKHRAQKEKIEEKINELNFELDYIVKESERLKLEIKEQETLFEEKIKERMKDYLLESEMKSFNNYGSDSKYYLEEIDKKEKQQASLKGVTQSNWKGLKKLEEKNPEIKRRNEMSRRMKITYTHYNH